MKKTEKKKTTLHLNVIQHQVSKLCICSAIYPIAKVISGFRYHRVANGIVFKARMQTTRWWPNMSIKPRDSGKIMGFPLYLRLFGIAFPTQVPYGALNRRRIAWCFIDATYLNILKLPRMRRQICVKGLSLRGSFSSSTRVTWTMPRSHIVHFILP